jgi:hypothetical protein
MSYKETMLIYAPLILEVSVGGPDIARIVAEVSSRMPAMEKEDIISTNTTKPTKRTRKTKNTEPKKDNSLTEG